MKKLLTLILAIFCALVTTPHGRAQEPAKPTTPEQELKALDLSWHQAVAARDAEALGRLLADDYRLDLDSRRVLTKAEEVEAVRAQDPLFDFGRFKLEEVTARVEGGRASVSGILTARPEGGDKKSRRRYFYTRAFVNRDGRWQVTGARLVTLWADAR
jgi:ketosteroid isomerase-like protein